MNILQKYSFLLLFIFLLPAVVTAQKRNPARAADALFDKQQYSAAIDKYKKAYTKVKKNKEEKNRISYQLAECYRLTGNYKRAEITYKRLVRNGWYKKHPEILLHYADALKINGKYEDAISQYNAYSELVPDDPRGKLGAQTAAQVKNWIENPSKYQVSNVKKINSREADFAPAFTSDNYNELIFTSTRDGAMGKETDKWTGQNFSDLFITKQDRKGEWSEPVLLDKSETVNTKANEGAAQMNAKFNRLYFTRCPNTPQVQSGCQIYVSQRTGRNWGKPKMVDIKGIDTLSTIGQPTMSESELILYFSAERKGGMGGKDIWVTTRDNKTEPFKRPMNLGPVVNTKGDEMFPFLRNDTTLYFASDGHGGMGGLDIFVTTVDSAGNWGPPQNLKYPINSSRDDFAIIFHPEEEWGYFSSNRKGGKGKEDIWYFIEPPLEFTLSGTVTDERSLLLVPDATVKIVGSDGISLSTITNDKGYYTFGKSQIKPNTTYDIVVSKENYFNSKGSITTKGVEFSKDFTKDFVLKPIPEEPVVLPDILYDLAKWDLKPQYQDSLQGLIQTLRDNPNIVIELASHTDSRDTEERNDILSQRRATSVVDYLILRGIDPARLIAKGYGERVPRKLKKDIVKDGFLFKKGTVLDDDFINSLSSKAEKEAAHALNRRTEFRVLRKDYIPKNANIAVDTTVRIALNPNDSTVPFKVEPKTGRRLVHCIINGYDEIFAYDRTTPATISIDKAMELLEKGVITKDDLEGDPAKLIKDNKLVNRAVLNIREVTIANKSVNDIKVRVNYKSKYDFIFGEEVLRKFGKFNFDDDKKVLTIGEKR